MLFARQPAESGFENQEGKDTDKLRDFQRTSRKLIDVQEIIKKVHGN